MCVLSGNVDPGNSSYAWVVDTAPPTTCWLSPKLPCASGVKVNTTRCTVDVKSTMEEGLVAMQYRLDNSSEWVASNSSTASLWVSQDGVHTVEVKVAQREMLPCQMPNVLWSNVPTE